MYSRERYLAYKKQHPEKVKEQNHRAYLKYAETHRDQIRIANRERRLRFHYQYPYNEADRHYRQQKRLALRNEAFRIYGNRCVCCGESTRLFLTLDHINGHGTAERKERGRKFTYGLLQDAVNHPDKSKWQILCYNCNCAIGHSGFCPHIQTEKETTPLKSRSNEWKYKRNLRLKIINHYTNGTMNCSCCGEDHIEFLTVDHINGGGYQHRKSITGPINRWLKKNKFPEGYQILCYNCNCGRHRNNGICPHHMKAQ